MADTSFAKQLLQLRKKKGITQEQLAGVLGVSAQAVSKWENGSYPEGDLLPKLADYFEVSIDFLYGREKKELTTEQRVIEELKKINFFDTSSEAQNFFDKALEIAWAMQTSPWVEIEESYPRPHFEIAKGVTSSLLCSVQGFSYMRLNEDLEYYFALKEPKEGFGKRLAPDERLAKAFAFLGDLDHLKIIHFLLGLKNVECVEAAVIAKKLGIPKKKVEEALSTLQVVGKGANPLLYSMTLLDDKDEMKPVYSANQQVFSSYLMVLCAMDYLMEPPKSFAMQIGCRNEAWMKENEPG